MSCHGFPNGVFEVGEDDAEGASPPVPARHGFRARKVTLLLFSISRSTYLKCTIIPMETYRYGR